MSNSALEPSKVREVSTIDSDMVPEGARVVFDWDNTLKVINKAERKIECRVSASLLSHLIEEKHCELFIISAIRPSKMNLDTLLMEVDRLALRQFFVREDHECTFENKCQAVASFPWMREGNIIICGYDKAEAFLTLLKDQSQDQVDSVGGESGNRPIVFFDDEEVNIQNFSAIVKGSWCYKVV